MQQCVCGGEVLAKGLCRKCYTRKRRRQRPRLSDAELYALRADWEPWFYARVDDGVWTGTATEQGYGMFSYKSHSYLAHRLAYMLATGDTTASVVMHSCDNPICCNPRHLRAGTHEDNMRDMVEKGRSERNGNRGVPKPTSGSYKRTYYLPWGTFPSANKAAAASPTPISANTLRRRYLRGYYGN